MQKKTLGRARLWSSYKDMKRRCLNPEDKSYKRYGARGIGVCPEWIDSFQSFCSWALRNGYRDDLQIDRIDNNADYCPENCRWVTAAENSRNCRNNVLSVETVRAARLAREVLHLPIVQIAKAMGVSSSVLGTAIRYRTWRDI